MILQCFPNFMERAVMHVLRRVLVRLMGKKERQKYTNPGPNYGIPQSQDGATGTPVRSKLLPGY